MLNCLSLGICYFGEMFSLNKKAYLSQDFYLFFCVFLVWRGWGEMSRDFMFFVFFFLFVIFMWVWGGGG